MNVVIMQGRFTKDPELREFGDGKAVLDFSLAVDRRGRDQGTDFFDFVAWDRTATNISKFFHKGENIVVKGRLRKEPYTKNDGTKVYKTDIVVDEFGFCERRNDR